MNQLEDDFRNYFNDNTDFTGLRSSWQNFVHSLYAPGKIQSVEPTYSIALINRHRRIHTILASKPQYNRYLSATYDDRYCFPAIIRTTFDIYTGIVLCNTTDIKHLTYLCQENYHNTIGYTDKQKLNKMKIDAIELYNTIHKEFYDIIKREKPKWVSNDRV